jgi:hypothetical protein
MPVTLNIELTGDDEAFGIYPNELKIEPGREGVVSLMYNSTKVSKVNQNFPLHHTAEIILEDKTNRRFIKFQLEGHADISLTLETQVPKDPTLANSIRLGSSLKV